MGNGELWPPTESKPLNWLPKNFHSWLRPRDDPPYQFWCKSFDWGFWANGWNITLNYFYIRTYVRTYVHTYVHTYVYLFFRGTTHRSDPSTDFDAWWLNRREITQGCAFWGLEKLKMTFKPFLAPPNVDFWRKNGLRKFSTENRLQWEFSRVNYP